MKDLFDRPFTLALSSGFFGFYAHVGFLKALEQLAIKPVAYTGTSAGAIISAAAAMGMKADDIGKLVTHITRKDFWDPSFGLGLLRGKKFQELLAREIGSDFSQLQKPLRIPVFEVATRTTQVITSGNLAQAVQASCAVPLMFQPVKINNRLYLDGGILDKMAIHGLNADEKILSHYLERLNPDPHSIYELRRDQQTVKDRGGDIIQVQMKGLPKSGPFAMHKGPEIIEAAYKRALHELS